MPKVEINQQKIIIALESRSPKSLTEVYRILGGKKLSGAEANRIRQACPGIEQVLAQNKAAGTLKAEETAMAGKPTLQTSGKPKSAKKTAKANIFPRNRANPFREGSNYSLAFDILAASKDGLPLTEWRESYAKAARKPLKLAGYDIQVLLTAKDSPTGERHRSCRDGFYVEREGDHVRIRFR